MNARASALAAVCLVGTALLSSCDQAPGKPKYADRWTAPHQIRDFEKLFSRNCRGCHSDGSNISQSISMRDPLYLAVIPHEAMHKAIAEGVPGTAMPGFSHENGGMLSDEQIDILVEGIFKWQTQKPDPSLPPYSAPIGDSTAGATAFGVYCASCHGADGTGVAGKAGSVVDSNYLGLVTDQYLRSVTIAGRPELGMPNFTSNVEGRPMSIEDIANVVAWLASHRAKAPTPASEVSQR